MKTAFSLFSAILLCTLSSLESQAGTLDDIGFTDLKLELGSDLPDGSSISVTQVEAPSPLDAITKTGPCIPNMAHAEFSLITFSDNTQGVAACTGDVSGHATSVAQKFFGAVTSASTAIGSVDLFETNNWLFSGFLNTYVAVNPGISATRLANHSWAGDAGDVNVNIDILRRVDFVVEQDEFVQVVAMSPNPSAKHLLSDSLNAIVVGLSQVSSSGTTALNSIYTAGRARPDIVAPESTVSSASPRGASAAALLMDYAHTNPLLSNGSTSNRDNIITIYNAERSETIKAILMAGADRNTVGNTNSIDITNYRVDVANQTNNGLDRRFGAGQINVYNSYHILAAGEQNSAEDGGIIFANTGFDYDPSFGGLNGSNATATYSFTTSAIGGQKIKAALVWNLDVLTISTDKLYNLDLQLIDVTGGNAIVASSTSTIDNTENLWFDLASNNAYQLKVIRGSGQAAFNWDYALAWQIVVPGVTVVETDSTTVTAEDGTTDTFTVVLDSPPSGDVTINLDSSDTAEGTVSPSSLTFTSANWSTLQTVTVTGVNDAFDDGDKNYSIGFTVSSGDANYDGMTLPSVLASNTDDDATFSFIDQVGVELSTVITSSAVVVTGVDAALAVSITGGEYSLNGSAYTTSDGFVNNNGSITVQIASSASGLTAVEAVLTIGGSADTFTVTTEADADDDGVGDSTDAFPDNFAASVDADNDGLPDEWNADCDTTCQGNSGLTLDTSLDDTDNDGVINANDAFPNNPSETTDTDGDGVGDNADAFPNDATETTDSDGDGVGDNEDAFPNNIAASADEDNDGKPDEWNASCDVTCQDNSGLTLDVASSNTSSGGGGSLSLMWLLLPLFITAGRRRVS